jgi:hypothetical protein
VTIVPMFRAIWISAGKSARAILIHWVLQPVAISEIDSTIARIVFDFEMVFVIGFELEFMMRLLLDFGCIGFDLERFAGSRTTMQMQAATGN